MSIITKTYLNQWINNLLDFSFNVKKPFSNIINKDKITPLSKKLPKKEDSEKSKPLIIVGAIVSLSSIFLLLYTINNKFGWYR